MSYREFESPVWGTSVPLGLEDECQDCGMDDVITRWEVNRRRCLWCIERHALARHRMMEAERLRWSNAKRESLGLDRLRLDWMRLVSIVWAVVCATILVVAIVLSVLGLVDPATVVAGPALLAGYWLAIDQL